MAKKGRLVWLNGMPIFLTKTETLSDIQDKLAAAFASGVLTVESFANRDEAEAAYPGLGDHIDQIKDMLI